MIMNKADKEIHEAEFGKLEDVKTKSILDPLFNGMDEMFGREREENPFEVVEGREEVRNFGSKPKMLPAGRDDA